MILGAMLVGNGPLTNPWMMSNIDDDDHPYHEYRWNEGFNLAILATSKELHAMGINLLYSRNLFRFTRLATEIGYENSTRRMASFLAKELIVYQPTESPRLVTRASLIQHVLVHDSDLDSDRLAGLHFGRVFTSASDSAQSTNLRLQFALAIIRRLAERSQQSAD